MSTTEQSELSALVPGLYHIVVAFSGGGFDGRRLTDAKGHVTIAPPSAHPDPAQQWRVVHVPGARDVVIIERPILAPPPRGIYLSYEGAPHPKEHAPVVVNLHKTEWIRGIGPGFTSILRVKNLEHPHFAISVAPAHAPPRPDPPLILDDKNELKWVFELVSPHVE